MFKDVSLFYFYVCVCVLSTQFCLGTAFHSRAQISTADHYFITLIIIIIIIAVISTHL